MSHPSIIRAGKSQWPYFCSNGASVGFTRPVRATAFPWQNGSMCPKKEWYPGLSDDEIVSRVFNA